VPFGPTISTRLIWPFARLMGDYQAELGVLERSGLVVATLADPDTRIPEETVMELLQVSIEKTKNPAIGLHAGERVEAGDFGVLDYAARSCATLKDALDCCSRYMSLLDDGLEARLVDVSDDRVAWSVRPKLRARAPAANDFVAASSINMGNRYIGEPFAPLEVRLMHSTPTDAREYERVFRAPVLMGQDSNAVVFRRAALQRPLALSNPDVFVAFDAQAQRAVAQLVDQQSSRARVREIMLQTLNSGVVSMERVAKQLHMSVATLRRRLAEEGTTHRRIADEVRRDLAIRYLGSRKLAISEIAFLLGFSNVPAFSKAFKRWTSRSPQEYREELRRAGAGRVNGV
jgi:AraC-like DNA-binding protein